MRNKKGKASNEQEAETLPDSSYIEEGDRLVDQGDFDGAIALYTEAISAEPADGFIYQLRGDAYLKKRDLGSAIADYTKALSLLEDNEDRALAYMYRAIAYKGKSDWHNVMADANAVIKTGYFSAMAYLARGSAYVMLGPMGQGFEDWKTAADHGSKSALAELEKYGITFTPLKKKAADEDGSATGDKKE